MKKLFKIIGKTFIALLLAAASYLFVGILWPLSSPTLGIPSDKTLITGASVVDVESGEIKTGLNILIQDGQVVAVGSSLDSNGAQVINAEGKFAIPGMFDMHTHGFKLSPELTHPLYVASGVTAVRDMGGCLHENDSWAACAGDKREWNQAVNAGTLIGPRYDQVTSLAMNGGRAIPAGFDVDLGGATPQGARDRVLIDSARGIDFLKTYTFLPADSYTALAEAAAEADMYLAGHLPFAVSGINAVAAGQRSFEHALLFVFECFPGFDALRDNPDFFASYTNELRMKMIAEHDPARCNALFQAMKEAGTAFVPTHTTRKLDARALDPDYRNDARLKYIPSPLRTMWLQDADGMARRAGEGGGAESYKAIFEFGLKQTGLAHRAGVTVMAGTDAPDSFAFPGLGLADELQHLKLAGLSNIDVLRAATLEPAKFLGLDGNAGVIKAGARADIVLLNRNPLDDVSATSDIDAVILSGVHYDRAALEEMLEGVEAAANSWSMWPKFAWQILRSPIMRKQFAD